MALTEIECKNAKPKEKPYKLAAGSGMYLEIMPSGSKLWRLKYRILGKENRISLGSYPDVKIKQATQKRDDAKRQLAEVLTLSNRLLSGQVGLLQFRKPV